jgi:hypothetical protein
MHPQTLCSGGGCQVRQYLFVEDLTIPNLGKLRELQGDRRVSRACEAAIKYTLVVIGSDPEMPRVVHDYCTFCSY